MGIAAEDILRIIEAAKNAGLSSLKAEGLELNFGGSPVSPAQETLPVTNIPVEEIDPEDNADLKERQLSEMMISNPERYEEMLMQSGGLQSGGLVGNGFEATNEA